MQRLAVEIRPALFGHPQFGVRDLPEEEVAYPHFTGGANKQVGIRHAGGVKRVGNQVFVDILRVELALFGLASKIAHGVEKLGSSPVVDSEAKNRARVVPAQPNTLVEFMQ